MVNFTNWNANLCDSSRRGASSEDKEVKEGWGWCEVRTASGRVELEGIEQSFRHIGKQR